MPKAILYAHLGGKWSDLRWGKWENLQDGIFNTRASILTWITVVISQGRLHIDHFGIKP